MTDSERRPSRGARHGWLWAAGPPLAYVAATLGFIWLGGKLGNASAGWGFALCFIGLVGTLEGRASFPEEWARRRVRWSGRAGMLVGVVWLVTASSAPWSWATAAAFAGLYMLAERIPLRH